MSFYRFATSELLSTYFPTWIWQGREWSKGRIPKYDPYYWGNAHAHPVLSTYYPPSIFLSAISTAGSKLDRIFRHYLCFLLVHYVVGCVAWFWLFSQHSTPRISLFGAITITFGAYALKQQPCIIYTLAWFPLSLYQNPLVSTTAIGMMLLSGYYPFAIYLMPVSIISHILWYQEAWLLFGIIMGLPQLIPFIKHLPKTIKRMNDKCEETPSVERRFYVGVVPILLLIFSKSSIWPLTIASAVFALGLGKSIFPRIHERWLMVLQFCIGWSSVSALTNLNLTNIQLILLVALHAFDLYWHNRECLPPSPYCELWRRPSRAFNTPLTRFLEANLGDYKVSGLPWPLFTGHINNLKTMGYCGSMQTKEMWSWRKSFKHDPFIDGVDECDLTNRGVGFAYSRKKLDWLHTGIPHLYRNPSTNGLQDRL